MESKLYNVKCRKETDKEKYERISEIIESIRTGKAA